MLGRFIVLLILILTLSISEQYRHQMFLLFGTFYKHLLDFLWSTVRGYYSSTHRSLLLNFLQINFFMLYGRFLGVTELLWAQICILDLDVSIPLIDWWDVGKGKRSIFRCDK